MPRKSRESESLQQLLRQLKRTPSERSFSLMRAWGLGGAAISLAILLQVAQVGTVDFALGVTVVSCAIAMPLWVFVAACVECYLYLGPESFPHSSLLYDSVLMKVIQFVGAIAVLSAIGGVLYHLSPLALWVFAITTVVAIVLYAAFFGNLAGWWYAASGRDGPQ